MQIHTYKELFIAVDIETAGPSPSQYSMLSLGACLVDDPENHFYTEIQPVTAEMLPEAFAIHGLSLEKLRDYGLPPADAMRAFERWVASVTPSNTQPIFVALNAPFDWMFVSDYFHRYLGRNPFGYAALDMKALFMGATGLPWANATLRTMHQWYAEHESGELTHNALQDAQDEARLFNKIISQISKHRQEQGSPSQSREGTQE